MTSLTLPQRAMLHLYRYRHVPPTISYGAPYEMTQDGLSEVLGISRSHSSVVANSLVDKGLLYPGKARIVGNDRSPRKIYFLTPDGLRECESLMASAGCRDPAELMEPCNINYCNSATFWSLPEEEKTRIGCLMVLRIPVHRNEVDIGPDNRLVPFNLKGVVHIKPETRRWYTQRADTETLRRWHSAAADWCLDRRCDPKEKLYHLFRANRRREAAKLAMGNRFMLMDFPDRECRDMLCSLAREFRDDTLHLASARMSLRMGETAVARCEVESMADRGGVAAGAMLSEVLLAEGMASEALDKALDSYVGDIDTSAALGICMTANGRYDEALTYLDRCGCEMRRTGCVFRIDEMLRTRSFALRALGETAAADAAADMAECWRKDPNLRFRRIRGSCWL